MFTGIIEEVGKIKDILKTGNTLILNIFSEKITKKINIGDSISVNGVCLTVTSFTDTNFKADVSPETFNITNLKYLKINDKVNLETALTLSKPLGGHIVAGHVDGISKILKKEQIENFIKISIEIPEGFRKYMIEKGSIAIDGISLTINSIKNNFFNIMVIPHTLENTNLLFKKAGDFVNIEVDIIGKYVENFIKFNEKNVSSKITEDFLKKHGF